MIWRAIIRCVGGIHEIGRYCLVIHDGGVMLAKEQIVSWHWSKRRPTKPVKRPVSDRMAVGE